MLLNFGLSHINTSFAIDEIECLDRLYQ